MSAFMCPACAEITDLNLIEITAGTMVTVDCEHCNETWRITVRVTNANPEDDE